MTLISGPIAFILVILAVFALFLGLPALARLVGRALLNLPYNAGIKRIFKRF
jgi:hypothetical protein